MFIGGLLVVAQTTVLPTLCAGGLCYDLLIPFVIHLGRCVSLRQALPMVLGLGLINDTLSAGTFGIYTTAYFWTLMLVHWLLTFLHARSSLIWPFIVALGVLLENAIIVVVATLAGSWPETLIPLWRMVLPQFLLAVVSGPFVLRFFHWLGQRFAALRRSASAANGA
jgi:cell shape-determining protein MreD